ncbi:restriction endonuclease [Candidatus Pacearchaeota archaeon]|nr:restriction endonuclease [Candidatus Pacearchaeota archaeon]
MDLSMYQKEVLQNYKSNSQIARILTENWFSREMYCPCCLNEGVDDFPNNQKGSDFFCEKCKNEFQLKASKNEFKRKVVDGEYNTMMNIISRDSSPNFFLMNYENANWTIKSLFLIPKFFISVSMIEKRNPLSKNAKRAGWVGCNFLLDRLPEEGKIQIVKDEKIIERNKINKVWKKMFFMNSKKPEFRGWASDVLKCVEELDNKFDLREIYKYDRYLKELHPMNNNIHAKIRQQLQVLRDNKVLSFCGNGRYEFLL